MTQFKNYELLCNQYFNIITEIASMIEQEEYEEVIGRMDYKDNFIKKLFLAKKTANFTQEENQKASLIEDKMKEFEEKTLASLMELQSKVGDELRTTNKQVKINSAYTISDGKEQGVLFNIDE